jgi:molybdate transport system permease protein
MAGKHMKNKGQFNIVTVLFVPLFALLIIYPTVALISNVRLEGMQRILEDPFFWRSVWNTFIAATGAAVLGLILAVGFGYFHVFHQDSVIYRVVNLFNDLPIALPHTVAGLALLIAFGRNNFGFVSRTGLAFNMFAVMIAMFFVSYPLCARSIASGVDQIDHEMIAVARTLGDSPVQAYFKVVLPSIGEAIFSGTVLAFSRALSEFAAVIMFGGNLPGKTQSLASYVFTKVEEGETGMAIAASVFCILLSLLIVLGLSIRRRLQHAEN